MSKLKSKAARLVEFAKQKCNQFILRQFSKEALRKIAVETVITSSSDLSEQDLYPAYEAELESQLEDTLQDASNDLCAALEDDAELSEERQKTMTPSEKIDAYLKNTCGIYDYTDDILKAISAAYGILLEPDL